MRARIPEERTISHGISLALQSLRQKFDRPTDIHNKLYYHSTRHTLEVIDKTRLLLGIFYPHYNSAQHCRILLACFAAAYHGIDQTWQPMQSSTHDRLQKRFRQAVYIESKSFAIANAYIQQANPQYLNLVFSPDDTELIRNAILVTIPKFDTNLSTIIQPLLNRNSAPEAQALALADLGVAGIDGPIKFLRDTDSLFLEDNLTYLDFLTRKIPGDRNLFEIFREEILNWTNRQLQFAIGRKEAFLTYELNLLPQFTRGDVAKLFANFDSTIEYMTHIAKLRQNMKFQDLIAHTKSYELLSS